jgi:NAD(P)-dependent dehydrogenase (short-subunit alcohol dehydrogenase family)
MSESSTRIWLVTGAAGELGAELIRRLMLDGAECIALDRNEKGLNALHDRLIAELGRAPVLLPLDLAGAGPADYEQVADRIGEQFGRLDGVIHNAADFKALRPLVHQPPDEWMKILQAGLTGPYLLNCALMDLLRATPDARLVFIEDGECLENPANWAAYGVAQAGRQWMARAMASEVGASPRVLSVDPGPFYSRLRVSAWPVARPDEFDSIEQVADRVLSSIDEESKHHVQ